MNNPCWYVTLVHDSDPTKNHVMGPFDKTKADRVADGAGINLNWNDWSIEVAEKPS